MKKKKWSVNKAASIIDNEGIGYAVLHYCRGSDFKDKDLATLWDVAAQSLKQLQTYIEENSTEEDDE